MSAKIISELTLGNLPLVPFYIAAIGAVMLANAVWRYRRWDMVGMTANALMAAFAAAALLLPVR